MSQTTATAPSSSSRLQMRRTSGNGLCLRNVALKSGSRCLKNDCQTCMPVFHASGSVVMGRPDDPAACVDTDFRVYGTKRLRVADLSVCPLILNGHTQAGAYQIGETAAEKIIAEYDLDQKADSSMMVKSRI